MKAEFAEFKAEMRIELKEFAENVVETILTGMDNMERRVMTVMDTRFGRVDDRLTNVEGRLDSIEIRLTRTEETVIEIQQELKGALKASDKHSLQLIDH